VKGADSGRLCRFRLKGGVPAKARATPGKDEHEESDSPAGSRLLSLPLRSSVPGRTVRPQIVRRGRVPTVV
jgi:hypothetical protein